MDISIVLNAHNEASRMQATLRSIARAMEFSNSQNVQCELIVVLDRPDSATKRYLDVWLERIFSKEHKPIVTEVDNGDLGASRNDGIELAKGTVSAVIDADDVYAKNYFVNALRAIQDRGEEDVVVHPRYVISFGDWSEVWTPISSDSPDFNLAAIVEYNPWPSQAIAKTSLFQKYKYNDTPVIDGFGPEDWYWNCQTLCDGVTHIAAENVAYFYRRKASNSLAHAHTSSLLPSADIFSMSGFLARQDEIQHAAYRGIENPVERDHTSLKVARRLNTVSYRLSKKIIKGHRVKYYLHRLYEENNHLFRPKATLAPQEEIEFPKWLIDEWHALHDIDHKIFPSHQNTHSNVFKPLPTKFSQIYWRMMSEISGAFTTEPDYVFFVPWLRTGGADLVILNYINAIKEIHAHSKIMVITTELAESSWHTLLPEGVLFYSLTSEFYDSLSDPEQTRLLGMLLVQLRPSVVHIVNSGLGFRLLTEYAKQISKASKIFVSAFAIDRTHEGERVHYLYDHLPYSIDYVTSILTDNGAVIDDLCARHGFDRSKFSINYQPAMPPALKGSDKCQIQIIKPQNLKIAWAARLDHAKRADILYEVARKALDNRMSVEFHVYGSALIDTTGILEKLKELPNVVYEGRFDRGVWQLPCEKIDLFLMTSQWEGLPNAMLQAAACKLPVMAPLVGGIGEFLTNQTGYPIDDYASVDEYILNIAAIIENSGELKEKSLAAYKLVTTRHSWPAFIETVKNQPGYL